VNVDWSTLGAIVENLNSKRIPLKKSDREKRDGEFPYYGASGIIDQVDDYIFDGEYLLIGEDGANLLARSTPIAFLAKGKFWVNNHAHVLGFNGKADLKFLAGYINSIDLTPYVTGSAQPKLNKNNLDKIRLPLPPLEEQKRIAAILDKADSLRRKREKAIALTDDLLRSVFLDMFGDPVTNPKGWETANVDKLCHKITDGTHHSPEPQDKGVPYITAKHLKPNKLDFYSKPTFVSQEAHEGIYSRCNPEKSDVLYIKDGATTGAAAINPYDFEFSMLSSLALIKTNTKYLTSEYLCDWLNFDGNKSRILQNMSGAAITRLTIRKIKDLMVELPPIGKQLEYKNVRIQILETHANLCKSTNCNNDLFSALTQRAFRGELTSQKEAI
jgi:type I restriction enzyme, S subunit